MGYDVIIYPSFAFLAAGAAMDAGFVELRTKGRVSSTPIMEFDDFSKMIGFDEIYEFDARWNDPSHD